MAENTEIGWTHFPRPDGSLMPGHTANLWWGCTEVHEGCKMCYARVFANRYKSQWGDYSLWGHNQPRKAISGVWKDLARYQKSAALAGETHAVFLGSMMDIFEKPYLLIDKDGVFITESKDGEIANTGWLRDRLFSEISIGKYDNLLFLFLTKRPSNINKYIPESWKDNPPKNVMFGTSPVNQETADKLIPQLLQVKGKKFLSVEPMLGVITLDPFWLIGNYTHQGQIDWVICGGESGHGKREFDTYWARDLRDQCAEVKVPFFMKQIDKIQEIPDDLLIRQYPVI